MSRRWRVRAASLAGLVMAAMTWAAPVRADDLGISMASGPGAEKSTQVTLRVPSGESSAAATIVLRQSGRKPLQNVTLLAAVGGKQLAFTAVGFQQGKPFTIPKSPGEVLVTLSVAGVAAAIDSRANLTIVVGTRPQSLGSIRLVKLPDDPLVIDQTKDGTFTDALTVDRYRKSLDIRSTVARPTRVTISLASLQGPDGAQVTPSLSSGANNSEGSAAVTVPGRSSVPIVVLADLTRSGTYRGTLVLTYGGQSHSTLVEITRSRVAASVDVDDIGAVRETLPSCFKVFWCRTPVETRVQLRLHETGGQRVELTPPHLALLLHENDTDFQVDPKHWKVEVDGTAVDSLVIEPDQSITATIVVDGIDMAGQYTATVTLDSVDGTDAAKSATIYVRESRRFASLLIAIGVLAGALIRWYRTTGRVRFVREQRLILLMTQLRRLTDQTGPQTPNSQNVIVGVRSRLDEVLQRVRSAGVSTKVEEADLETEGRRLRLLAHWLATSRSAERTKDLSQLNALAAVETIIRGDMISAEVEAATMDKLAAIDGALTGATVLGERITSISADIDAALAGPSPADPQTASELRAMSATLGDARRQLASGDIAAAQTAVNGVIERWTTYQVDMLEQSVAGNRGIPLGMKDQVSWDSLRKEVMDAVVEARGAADLMTKIASYQRGATALVSTLAAALQDRLDSKSKAVIRADKNLSDTLAALAVRAGLAAQDAREGNLAAASKAYGEVLADYRKQEAPLAALSQQLGGNTLEVPAANPQGPTQLPNPTPVATIVPLLPAEPSFRRRWWQVLLADVMVNAVIMIVSVVLGLSLLYNSSASWGRPADVVVALLWGLGLQTVGTGGAFKGLAGLRNDVGGA